MNPARRAANLERWRETVKAANADRAEDLHFMADTGENLTGAARRLGVTPDNLSRWCERHGLHEPLTRLRAREDTSRLHDLSSINRANANRRYGKEAS